MIHDRFSYLSFLACKLHGAHHFCLIFFSHENKHEFFLERPLVFHKMLLFTNCVAGWENAWQKYCYFTNVSFRETRDVVHHIDSIGMYSLTNWLFCFKQQHFLTFENLLEMRVCDILLRKITLGSIFRYSRIFRWDLSLNAFWSQCMCGKKGKVLCPISRWEDVKAGSSQVS